jgi:hypothetical protein
MKSEVRKIVRSTCLTKGLDQKVGEAIINSLFKQFKELAEEASNEDDKSFKNFRIINFGILYSEEKQRERIIKRKEYVKTM